MILDDFIEINISNRNIRYYKEIGYDVSINNIIKVHIKDVYKGSNVKVNVECDLCISQYRISLCHYMKNIKTGGYYTCIKCSHNKINKDNLLDIIKKSTKTKKEKYDKITERIEKDKFLFCKKCNIKQELENFKKNKNGRYIQCCKKCKSNDFKLYYKNIDKDIIRERKRRYYRNSLTNNLWRSILRSYLFRKNIKKLNETIKILGYSSKSLRDHLECRFDSYMNWDNYGEYWQVDHIIPVSLFKDESPINIVNSLVNLRPLEKNYNLSRGNKLDDCGLLLFNDFETYIKDEYINIYKNKI
jgi:hypothetical protein